MSSFRHSLGLIFVAIITICPVILWLFLSKSQSNFLVSLGQLTAILGTTLFALNFILSARYHFLEKVFVGLNRVYFYHHYMGAVSLILLLFHPVLLSLQYLPVSIIFVAKFFIPSRSLPENFIGGVALFIMIILLFITFFLKIKYQLWKFSHQLLGISFGVAIIHMLIVPGNLDQNPSLKIYLLTLSTLAIISFIYRTVFFKKLVHRSSYVVNTSKVVGEVTEINLSPTKKALTYQPGQFIFMEINSKGITSEIHPFSLTSSPNDPNISIAAKSLGDYTETLKLVKPGDTVLVEGPFGVFSYLNTANPRQLWIAGGIGVTPFLGMTKHLDPTSPYTIDLIYTVATQSEAIYTQIFLDAATKNPKFHFHLYSSKDCGRIDATKISALVPDLKSKDIFICGPVPMMNALKSQFTTLGIKPRAIHTEDFALYQGK